MASTRSTAGKRTWPLAPLLLCFVSMTTTGCLNLLFDPKFAATLDHAPVVTGMEPAPDAGKIPANIGTACASPTFFAQSVDDADGDDLTVRWVLRFPRDPQGNGDIQTVPRQLLEFSVTKLPAPVDGKNYDFPPFEVDHQTVVDSGAFDEGEVQNLATIAELANAGELLEVFISDTGFKAGTNDPNDGGAVVFFSWAIELQDTACGT